MVKEGEDPAVQPAPCRVEMVWWGAGMIKEVSGGWMSWAPEMFDAGSQHEVCTCMRAYLSVSLGS